MKKVRTVCCMLLCAAFFVFGVSAKEMAPYASDQIDSYYMDVIPLKGGKMAVEFSIVGNDTMDAIGCESIKVYRRGGSYWVFTAEFTRDDDGMMNTNTGVWDNTIYYQGTTGTQYKFVVEVFAETSSGFAEGYDSRSESFIVTGQ